MNIKNVRNCGVGRVLRWSAILGFCLFVGTSCSEIKQTKNTNETTKYTEQQDDNTTSAGDSTEIPPTTEIFQELSEQVIIPDGSSIIERFRVPEGYKRIEPEADSFAYYLQNLPLKPHGEKVKYYDGREKPEDAYLAVVDYDLEDRDLQQCADAVIRLRAEYLYAMNRQDEIQFHFVSGFNAEFEKWAAGNSISVSGNDVTWSSGSSNDGSYESFQRYLNVVYSYASTISLEQELIEKPFSDISIGDVFIQGGSPGHCVIVVDLAVNETTGEKVFILAQSYMPAQDIQVLRGDSEDSPWVSGNKADILDTPQWTFKTSDIKTW